MGEGARPDASDPVDGIRAAQERAKQAEAAEAALRTKYLEMREFSDKGDAVADGIIADLASKLKAAEAATMEADSALIQARKDAAAAVKAKSAATPVDELLMGAAAPADAPPPAAGP